MVMIGTHDQSCRLTKAAPGNTLPSSSYLHVDLAPPSNAQLVADLAQPPDPLLAPVLR